MDSAVSPPSPQWWVACLCAAWCGACREWQPTFVEQARAHPQMHFAWVDVEDEDEAMGEVDIETFPTLLVARGDQVLFLGPIPPLGPQFTRLLATLQAQSGPGSAPGPDADALFARLHANVLPRTLV